MKIVRTNGTVRKNSTTKPMIRVVQIRFDVILKPEQALPISTLEQKGKLGTMYWGIPRADVRIQLTENQPFRGDLMPELEREWKTHLDAIRFPVGATEDERTISAKYGREGLRKLKTHYQRERAPGLAKRKRDEALARYGKLECEVCHFDFQLRYGEHGFGFMEVHHLAPLMEAPEDGRDVSTDDVALVCANCHRMIHCGTEALTLCALRAMVTAGL
jgi:hypothetical protein